LAKVLLTIFVFPFIARLRLIDEKIGHTLLPFYARASQASATSRTGH
jgi:hypothetical protein